MRVLIKNISILLFFIFLLVFSNSSKSYAYDCYSASNADTVAPDNGSICANMYIVPSTTGAGAIKLKSATHSGSNAYISHGGENYWLGEETGKKKSLPAKLQILVEFFIIKETLMQILATGI